MQLHGWTVAAQLDELQDRLMRGDVQLWELHPALAGFFIAGYDAGRASLERDIEQARADADLYYALAHSTPEERANLIARRMDAAAARSHPTDAAQYAAMLDAALERPGRAAA